MIAGRVPEAVPCSAGAFQFPRLNLLALTLTYKHIRAFMPVPNFLPLAASCWRHVPFET